MTNNLVAATCESIRLAYVGIIDGKTPEQSLAEIRHHLFQMFRDTLPVSLETLAVEGRAYAVILLSLGGRVNE